MGQRLKLIGKRLIFKAREMFLIPMETPSKASIRCPKSMVKDFTSGALTIQSMTANSKRTVWKDKPKFTLPTDSTTSAELKMGKEMGKENMSTKMEIHSMGNGRMT